MNLTESIKQKALDLGFDLVGITGAGPIDSLQTDYLADWLKKDFAANMTYMHKNFDKRTRPAKLLPNAKSVICVALNYRPIQTPPPKTSTPLGRVANFALYQDYHGFMKKLLAKLCDFITDSVKPKKHTCKICVDSAPLLERALARRAGLGFIGKNHMLINPRLGAQILLGEIITDLDLTHDAPIEDRCSNCEKCINACPTGALSPDDRFDARKCISYLTIEHTGAIDTRLMPKIDMKLFGCDDCILACPYEKNAPPCTNKKFRFFPQTKWLNLQKILDLDTAEFDKHFNDSTVKRLGLEGLKGNAKICLANARTNQGTKKKSSSLKGVSHPR